MSLGVLNNLSAMYAANNLNNTQNSLTKTLQQLSSGSRINSGADDAAGLSLVNGLAANASALAQSQTNAQEGVGLLQVADGALSQVTNLLNRAVTLATEASNGTLNASQDQAANQEYQAILAEINNIGSTTTYNQQQVFNSSTNVYVGDSSTQGASINSLSISALSSSNIGDTGGVMAYSNGQNNVFINLSNGSANAGLNDSLNAGGTTSLNVTYRVGGANGGSSTATTAITVGGSSGYANTAQGLISAINNAGLGLTATFTTQAKAGVQGGGSQTGIMITGGLISTGSAPSTSSTSGVLNADGIPANQLLTNGQTVTVKEGNSTVASVTIGTTANDPSIGGYVNTLSELAASINHQAGAGTATVITNGDGTQSLSLQNASGSAALSVTTSGGATAPVQYTAVAGTNTTDVQTKTSVAGAQSVTAVASSVTIGAAATSTATPGNPSTPGNTVLSAGGSITVQAVLPNVTNTYTFVVGTGVDNATTFYTANYGDNSNSLSNLAAMINAKAGASSKLDATAVVGATGGLTITSNTAQATENLSVTANSLSTATNTVGLYSPQLATNGQYATAILQLDSGDPLGANLNDATAQLTGSFTLTNNGVSTTYVIGTGVNDTVSATNVYYTGTGTESVANLVSFINGNQTSGMNVSASAPGGGTGGIYLQATAPIDGTTVTTGISMTQGTASEGPLADSVAMSGVGNASSVAGVTAVAGNAAALTVGPASGTVNTSDVLSSAGGQNSIAITNGGITDTFIVGAGTDVSTGSARTYYTANHGDGSNTLANLAATINGDTAHLNVTATASTAGLVLTQSQTPGNYTGGNITATTTLTDTTKGTYATDTISGFGSASDTVSGTIQYSLGSGSLTAKTFTATAGETVSQMVDQINQNTATLGVTAQLVSGANGSVSVKLISNTEGTAGNITSNAAAISTLADTTTTANLSYTATSAYNIGLSSISGIEDSTTGQGSAASFSANQKAGSGIATISYSHGAGQSLAATDLSNQTDAQAALNALNAAITDVAAQDGYIGAMINTLNSVSQVISTQQQNVVAAQNAVQATDYATAASNMSKYQILSQTGISALAQANSMQQEVVKLLQ